MLRFYFVFLSLLKLLVSEWCLLVKGPSLTSNSRAQGRYHIPTGVSLMIPRKMNSMLRALSWALIWVIVSASSHTCVLWSTIFEILGGKSRGQAMQIDQSLLEIRSAALHMSGGMNTAALRFSRHLTAILNRSGRFQCRSCSLLVIAWLSLAL